MSSVEVHVPRYVDRNGTATVECKYDLEDDLLYAVKWYKDSREFFRYVQNEKPNKKVFFARDFNVDVHKSNKHIVFIKSIESSASGRYDCEVTTDAPFFRTAANHSMMTVIGKNEKKTTTTTLELHTQLIMIFNFPF